MDAGPKQGLLPSTPELLRSVHNADGGIVLDVGKNKIFSLNSSGSVIFQLLEREVPEDQIVEEIVRRFDVPANIAKADLAEFCRSLKDYALLGRGANSESE